MSEQEMNAADAEDTAGHVHWTSEDPMGPADSSFRRGRRRGLGLQGR